MKTVVQRSAWYAMIALLVASSPLFAEGEMEGGPVAAPSGTSIPAGDCEWPQWRGPDRDSTISVPGFSPSQGSMPTEPT